MGQQTLDSAGRSDRRDSRARVTLAVGMGRISRRGLGVPAQFAILSYAKRAGSSREKPGITTGTRSARRQEQVIRQNWRSTPSALRGGRAPFAPSTGSGLRGPWAPVRQAHSRRPSRASDTVLPPPAFLPSCIP
jgi:hypothetical protein